MQHVFAPGADTLGGQAVQPTSRLFRRIAACVSTVSIPFSFRVRDDSCSHGSRPMPDDSVGGGLTIVGSWAQTPPWEVSASADEFSEVAMARGSPAKCE